MFATSPGPVRLAGLGLRLVRAERLGFDGPARFLREPAGRAHLDTYLADLTRPYDLPYHPPAEYGQSYGEMAEVLIGNTVPADEPVDLLVLAFAVHDMQPGRATATYLSHVCPGTPLSFALCEQGSAAPFSGLRVAREYAASAGCRRALLIVAEQAVLPYPAGSTSAPARHQAVALLFGAEAESSTGSRLVALRQRSGVPSSLVPAQAAAEFSELAAECSAPRLLLSQALASAWPAADAPAGALVAPAGQPLTGLWWQLLDELSAADPPDLLVAAGYDPQLGCLSLAAFVPA